MDIFHHQNFEYINKIPFFSCIIVVVHAIGETNVWNYFVWVGPQGGLVHFPIFIELYCMIAWWKKHNIRPVRQMETVVIWCR